MRIIELTCPACGANLDVDLTKRQAKCPYCSAVFPVDDGVQHVRYDNAEQAGYEFERGRQKAQAELFSRQGRQSYQDRQIQPKKHTGCLWTLGWLLVFPIPVTVLMVRNRSLGLKIRVGIAIAAWIAYYLFMLPPIPGNLQWGSQSYTKDEAAAAKATEEESAYLIGKLSEIEHIQNPTAATKYHDAMNGLNRGHGYIAVVYFTSDLVEDELKESNPIDRGTDGGGCIEAYRNEEDALRRDKYLSSGFLSRLVAGSHCVCGKYVIRTSSKLERYQQKNLEDSIREALLSSD